MTVESQDGMTVEIDDIALRQFSPARRGFDRDQVRQFLMELAEEQRNLAARAEYAEARLDEAYEKLQSVQQLLRAADEKYQAAEARLAQVDGERSSLVRGSDDPQFRAVEVLGEKVTDVLQAALTAADSVRSEAAQWAGECRQRAAEDADRAVASARQEIAELVAQEEATVERLRSTRESLLNWLQAAYGGIGRVLDQASAGPNDMPALPAELHQLVGPPEVKDEPAPRPAWVPDHLLG